MKTIKKHVIKSFLKPFIAGTTALMIIMIITHFFDFMHLFLENQPSLDLFLTYYLWRIPQWLVTVIPVAVLLASLFSFSALKRHNEITAIRASGIKTGYILKPLIILSVFISLFTGIFTESVVTQSTEKADDLFLKIRGREPEDPEKLQTREDFKYMSRRKRIYKIERLHHNTAQGITVIEFFPATTVEHKIITASRAEHKKNNHWVFNEGSERIFDKSGNLISFKNFTQKKYNFPEKPETFFEPQRDPEEMDILSLFLHINRLKRSGLAALEPVVIFHYKIAFPFASTIILIFGVSIALTTGLKNRTTSFFFAILAAFLYWGALSIGKALAAEGKLPPVLGAWSANLIFLIAGFALLKYSKHT